MTARTLMVQGTASSVGKSVIVTGLCRLFVRAGLRVAPFKAQNMALNAAVSHDGGEIGRAQAVQAEAAGVPSSVDMNPILLKPEGDARAQVVVLGRPWASLRAADYHARKPELRRIVGESLARLRAHADLVVIEGAGSPAEVNLRDRDIVNMDVAHAADAPVLLVGDIDRGGVFAAFVGTIELLEPEDRARVRAFIVNKFRGDRTLLEPGLELLSQRTGIPVLGVLPFLRALGIADEDSVSLDHRARRPPGPSDLDIAIVRLPRISNFDDFDALEAEPGVVVRYVDRPEDLGGADLLVVPGSKSTIADLEWLRSSGLAAAIVARAARAEPVLGICGGCQMLGREILDPDGIESGVLQADGLGLLPLVTRFRRKKITARTRARAIAAGFLGATGDEEVQGYEIHQGETARVDGGMAAFELVARNGEACSVPDGATSADGAVVGTMLHGVFGNDAVRAALLSRLRAWRGLAAPTPGEPPRSRDAAYNRLARALLDGLDWERLCAIAGITAPPPRFEER